MDFNLSPRSSPQDEIAQMPDPNEIVSLLMIKGQQMPTYEINSRESTPDITINAKQWIEKGEYLLKSINYYLDNTFDLEQWRKDNILNSRYWQIEADYWEGCYIDSLNNEYKLGRVSQEADHLGDQQAQSNICFFRDIGQFDWLSIYNQLISKSLIVAQDSPSLVFDITYHCHRASHWANLHEEQGNAQVRKDIEALYYWQTEFTWLHRELLKLERKQQGIESKHSLTLGVLKSRTNARRPSNGGDKKNSRSPVRDKKRVKAGNLRRSARLRRQSPPAASAA